MELLVCVRKRWDKHRAWRVILVGVDDGVECPFVALHLVSAYGHSSWIIFASEWGQHQQPARRRRWRQSADSEFTILDSTFLMMIRMFREIFTSSVVIHGGFLLPLPTL
jgi:hypothetical protein